MRRSLAMAALTAFLSPRASGQPATPRSVFEVASVKQNQSGVRTGSVDFPKGGERFIATNMSLGALILIAYNLTVREILGAAALPSGTYDISAKADHPVASQEMLRMLQALLADRFKLVVHREAREVPIYALTIAKGGTKLHQSDPPDADLPVTRIPAHAGGTESRSGHLAFKNESMSDFAWALSRTAGIGDRLVVDETGLKAVYDFDLTFERDSVPLAGAETREPITRQAPTLFIALQEQLGLKLEPRKAPIEFLIIDHAEAPSAN